MGKTFQKLRKTKQRSAVGKVLAEFRRPLNAQEIFSFASRDVSGMGIATVYRCINDMMRRGEIESVEIPGQPPRYQPAGSSNSFSRMICTQCGRVFNMKAMKKKATPKQTEGFIVQRREILFYGLPQQCENNESYCKFDEEEGIPVSQ